jgi:hypothetical protein
VIPPPGQYAKNFIELKVQDLVFLYSERANFNYTFRQVHGNQFDSLFSPSFSSSQGLDMCTHDSGLSREVSQEQNIVGITFEVAQSYTYL